MMKLMNNIYTNTMTTTTQIKTPGGFKMAVGCVEVDLVSYDCHTAHN